MSAPEIESVNLQVEPGLLRHKSIRWLLAIHLLAGVVLTILSAVQLEIATAIVVLLMLVQANLLAGWASLSRKTATSRMIGLILAASGLSLELALASGFEVDAEFYTMLLGVVWGTGAVGLFARFYFGPLKFCDASTSQQLTTKWQFSIRQLMFLTFMVCLALAFTRFVKSRSDLFDGWEIAAIAVCFFISLGAICIWAMLGIPMPWLRGLGAFLLAIYFSYLWSILIEGDWFATELSVVMLIYQASFVFLTLLSLYIIRRCGYRLIRTESLSFEHGVESVNEMDQQVGNGHIQLPPK